VRIPEFKLERYFARWEFKAPYLLCASDVEGFRLAELFALADQELATRWQGLSLGYTEAAGDPALRQEISRLYEQVAPDDVLVFSGAQEAIFVLANTVVGPGDHVVCVWPAYQSLYEVARAAGAEVTLVPLRADDGWRLEVDRVRRAVRPNTRLIVINYPHSPTGAQLEPAELRELAGIAANARATLLSDEVYRFLEHDGNPLPGAVDLSESAVSLGVMSKSFALAGLRIGWIATRDRRLLERAAAFKDYTTICASAPSELLATIALRARRQVLERSQRIVRGNLDLLDEFFGRHADRFRWIRPRASSVAFPELLGDMNIAEFTDRLVHETGVLLLPGTIFEHPGNHFRLGYGRRDLPAALDRLEGFLDGHRP
jgi:aspartate/methionine/tyrosine aminotransferase